MVKVNFKSIIKNIKTAQSKLGDGVKVCAVIKYNAFGVAALTYAKNIEPFVDMFAVSSIDDAAKARKSGITKPILLLGVCTDIHKAVHHDITVTVTSLTCMQKIQSKVKHGKLNIHIEINTGMNRFGISSPWQLRSIIKICNANKHLNLCGMYTHFSHEYNNEIGRSATDLQIKRFLPYRAMFKRLCPNGIVHAARSGTMQCRDAQFDMVRIGKAMFGAYEGYKNVASVSAEIVAVQNVKKGDTVGYLNKYIVPHNMTIGVVNCGYIQAPLLNLGIVKKVIVDKTECDVIGLACTDSFFINVSNVNSPLGKRVHIIGDTKNIRVNDYVKSSGITGAKIISGVGPILR